MRRNLLITRGALIGILLAYLAILAAFVALIVLQRNFDLQQTRVTSQQHRLNHQTKVLREGLAANRRALGYICSTTTILDKLVLSGASQIQQNFANGTYQKLEARGILSAQNVAATRDLLGSYRRAHVKLTHDSACNEVRRR